MSRTWTLKNEQQMLDLGARLGALCKRGDFVALYGDLGAGKTVLARGVGLAFGIEGMRSPTFTIVQQYQTEPPLYHFDAYRLESADELYAMGFTDYFDGIILMEWANLVEEALPAERLNVTIEGSGDMLRTVLIEARGQRYKALLEQL